MTEKMKKKVLYFVICLDFVKLWHFHSYKFVDLPKEVNIDVTEGKIYSNEILTRNWIFCPTSEGDYEFNILCGFLADSSYHETETIYIAISVAGTCKSGYLVVIERNKFSLVVDRRKKEFHDFGNLLFKWLIVQAIPGELIFEKQSYDEPQSLFFKLTNPGLVEMPYLLTIQHENWPYEEKDSQQRVKLQPNLGNLFPGDEERIEVTLVPRERGHHEVSLRYFLRKNSQSNCLISTNESEEICKLKYFCYVPVIKVRAIYTFYTNLARL